MCPQLVDFNADGQPDLIVGTFEGVAFLVPGTKDGFKEPERILDADGKTILLSSYWDNEKKAWKNADRSPPGIKHPDDHCISVVALDWDNNGTLDLLLGAKEGGLYLRRNSGKPGQPKFATTNERIKSADGKDFMVPGGLTAPRLIDWNRDGLFDLVCGSFEGGVYLYLNEGKPGVPLFGEPVVLIPGVKDVDQSATEPTRPQEGSYVDVVDYDGDGKLDLLVGGYSHWTPKPRDLSDDEKKELEKLIKEINKLQQEQSQMIGDVVTEAKEDSEKMNKLMTELSKTEKYRQVYYGLEKGRERQQELNPQNSREAFVWLYQQK